MAGTRSTASTPPAGAAERNYKIGEVVEMTGLTHRTLRYYEELGLLGKRHHQRGQARVYTPQEVERLRDIQLWQQFPGFSLKQIKGMTEKAQIVKRLMEEARGEPPGPKRTEKLLQARQQLQTFLDIVERRLEKLTLGRKRMRAAIARIDKELEKQ